MKKKGLLILGAIAIATILAVNVTLITGSNSKLSIASLISEAKADGEGCGYVVTGPTAIIMRWGMEWACTPSREACTGQTAVWCDQI
jgi:hypothetical protein